MTTALERRLAQVILAGAPFTADDVTENGAITVDGAHQPNGAQSSIGSMFQRMARDGYIVSTDRVVRSRAPHRKGGAIRVWEPTHAGVVWAEAVT